MGLAILLHVCTDIVDHTPQKRVFAQSPGTGLLTGRLCISSSCMNGASLHDDHNESPACTKHQLNKPTENHINLFRQGYSIGVWNLPVPLERKKVNRNQLLNTPLIERCRHLARWHQPGPWFNIKISFYQCRKSHCGYNTVVRSSHLHNGISYTGKMASLFWISPLMSCSYSTHWLDL